MSGWLDRAPAKVKPNMVLYYSWCQTMEIKDAVVVVSTPKPLLADTDVKDATEAVWFYTAIII